MWIAQSLVLINLSFMFHRRKREFQNARTDAEKIKIVQNILQNELGLDGRLTLKKCEQIKRKREEIKEIEELGTIPIIDDTLRTKNSDELTNPPSDLRLGISRIIDDEDSDE